MDRLVYLSMGAAKATLQRQEVLAHNLANASTAGFRAELAAFRAVPVRGDGASTRVYALESTIGHDPTPGVMQATGRQLDVAARGGAWFTVQALDGTEAYTRAGSFDIDAQGQLVTIGGRLPVLGDGGAISIPDNAMVEIASDGTVSARVGQEKPQNVGRLKLVTPQGPLTRGDDGLFRAGNGGLQADDTARLQSGALESSNVNAIETMVAMISAARQFEQQMKMLQSAQQKEEAAQKLLGTQ